MASVFFGYPAQPRAQAEVLRTVSEQLNFLDVVESITWEDLRVEGRLVITEVLRAIDDSDMAIFDLTDPNPNVLFEAGYAIGRGKQVWLTLETSLTRAKRSWTELAILKAVGYTAYKNSDELVERFRSQDPLNSVVPLYDSIIDPLIPEDEERNTLLYCATFEPFEAANKLTNFIDSRRRSGLSVAVSDPNESSYTTLNWFVPEIARSAGVLINFAGPGRNQSKLHNNRHAFVAGLAKGLDVPVLLLAEADYEAPFDYEELLFKYESSQQCLQHARTWLEKLSFEKTSWHPRRQPVNRLAGLRLGEHVAENERTELYDYFVKTAAYHEVVGARDSVFVGHRGTGKTANAIQAFEAIAGNKNNLAILIKPPGFEFPAMLSAVNKLPHFQHDYFFDALWRFVIQTEIANTVWQQLNNRSKYVPFSADEQLFLDFVEDAEFNIREEMSVRLEQVLGNLAERLDLLEDKTGSGRNLINEAFHDSALTILRSKLGIVLKTKKRVAVFVDNLDKGWKEGADFAIMADFILGLLTARGHVVTDFEREDYWRASIKLTVAIFLRSDIYTYVRKAAREPDKLPISTIAWKDSETLIRVIEERFSNAVGGGERRSRMWQDYFCSEVRGVPIREFITTSVLPRPRDIVFFCNAALGRAVDRNHSIVEEGDWLAASEEYSQYAYEALLVENGVTIPEMQNSLLGFYDSPSIDSVANRLRRLTEIAGLSVERARVVIDKLVAMSFFGLEIAIGHFEYPEVGTQLDRAKTRARMVERKYEQRNLSIHPAFHAFLSVVAGPASPPV